MAVYNPLQVRTVDIRPRQRPIVEKNLAHVIPQLISIPDTKMERLVAAEPDTLQVERRKHVIDARHPLRHSNVIRIFRFKEELEVHVRQRAIESAGATIGSYPGQRGIALAN